MIPLNLSPLDMMKSLAGPKASAPLEKPAHASENKKTREAALEFESILVRQMLGPLEKSLTAGIGGGGASAPMVGSMVLESLSRSIAEGGGLGLADVIEQALTAASGTSSQRSGETK